MKLVVVSGRSGSGKSTALHILEDMNFYCIDNLPLSLLSPLAKQMGQGEFANIDKLAASIDARNNSADFSAFPSVLETLRKTDILTEILYLDAAEPALLKRFSATRRKHPLTTSATSLAEALQQEKALLEPISASADLSIDTTHLSVHQLRDLVKRRVALKVGEEIALLFESFGFKHGIPVDADMVFDVRCLPNPYWDTSLRDYTGHDQPVIEFLESDPMVADMLTDIQQHLEKWLPRFQDNSRSYMTVAIGCTGGQHRSVYLTEHLASIFSQQYKNVQVRHRELSF